jgi:hypothetical protein
MMANEYADLTDAIVREQSPRHYQPERWYHEHERRIGLGQLRAPVESALNSEAFAAWLAEHDAQVAAMPEQVRLVVVPAVMARPGDVFIFGGPPVVDVELVLMDDGTVRWERA